MAQLEININPAQIREIEAMFAGIKNGSKRVLTRAVNKTLTGVKTDMVDEAYQDLNVTKKIIRDAIRINRAAWTKLTGKASRTGKPLALAKFSGTRQTKKGVSAKVLRAGARSILKHAFIAKMKSGHIGVFWREEQVGTATRKWTPEQAAWFGTLPRTPKGIGGLRTHIQELSGPRVEDILSSPDHWRVIEAKAGDRFVKNMEHEVNFELSRL